MKTNLSKLPFTCVKTKNFYTGKASKKLAFATILFLVTWNYSFGQYQIDYSKNFDTIVKEWRAVCDSLYDVNLQNGDTSNHGTGYSKFLRWKNEWEVYMPSSGNFQDAMNIKTKVMEDKRLEHLLNSSDSTNQTNSLQVPAVDWIEIGPNKYSTIQNKNTGINPHVQTPQGNVSFFGHVGKFENIYQHPTYPDTLYACAGGYDAGGGGLFKSEDYGETWEILGTDKIPDPKIYSLAIKPQGQNPSPSQEILFIGLASGAVYRSIDDGVNWYEAGYNGTVNYPFVNGSVNPSQSLPYSFDYLNMIGAQDVELQEVEYTGKSHSLSDQYGRLVVCRTGGLFYSDNADASISINTANQTLTNNIVWNKFNTDNIIDEIENDPIISTTQVKNYTFTDFTSFRDENDQLVYAANLHFIEFDENLLDAINTNKVRQYTIISYDLGVTWSFLGGYNASNSSFGEVISKSPFTCTAKIECIKNNPQYLYASFIAEGLNDITNIRRYNFTNNTWTDISHSSFELFGVGYISRAFALNPTNENDYWVFAGGSALHMLNDQEVSNEFSYGGRFHPDVRAAMFTNSGDLFIGTDGNICKTVFNGGNPYWIPTSEGLNASQAGTIAVTQQAPYYVYSGFWHCGFQIYNPLTNSWKHDIAPLDGSGGFSTFLNKDRYFCRNTNTLLISLKNFNNLATFTPTNSTGYSINKFRLSSLTASSENIPGRIYGINLNYSGSSAINFDMAKSSDEVNYSNNDYDNALGFFNGFTAGTSAYDYPKDSSILTFPAFQTNLFTIPNQPDLLMVLDHSKGAVLHLYSGMNTTNPTPVLEKTINLRTLFDDDEIGDIRIEFDHRKNNICWITLKGRPIWSINEPLRVIEFNYITEEHDDLTHSLDRPTTQSSASFPGYVATTDIAMDRQTGVLYLSTSEGIFYLDRVNEIWRRYSDNVPYFKSSLEIIHCLGEIYTATSHRGIWKAELIRNQDTPTIEWNVTQNETWNNRMNLFCTLVIEPNVTLTIKDELKVYGGQKIIVKPGGHLVLDGGIITSECGDWWEGIEVWGNPAVSQNTPTNQGRLTTKNNAVIEHAHEAIRVWKPGDWSSMGGIVNCSNTTFRNNWRSCEYMPYHFYTSSITPVEYPNKGIFNKCNFVWDDDYFHSSISCGISMYHVNGVSIRGCNFRDLRTGTVADRPNGITSIDAGYSVLGIDLNPGPWNNPNIDYYFDSTDFIIGTFENLENGVSLMSSNTTFPIKVDHTKFKNCNVGVLIDAMDQAIITRNYFENTTTNPQANQEMYQLVFRNATDYTISGNLFNNSNVWGALGVGVYNSGMDDNAVYDNKFDGLNEGIYAYGFNSNDLTGILNSKGLVWKCNEFDHGYIDLIDYVPSYSSAYDGEGVKLLQGTINSSIGNLLSTGITSGGAPYDEHLYHTDQDLMGYFYHGLNALENPTERWGNIAANDIPDPRDCPSHFESTFVGIGQVLTPAVRSNVEGTLGRIETSIQDKTDSLNDLLFDGNRPGLYSLVAGINLSNRSSVHTSLLSESPYLSQSLLEELGEVDPAIYPHDWYRDLIIENSEVALNPDFIQFLSAKAYPLPDPDLANVKLSRFVHTTARGEKEMEIMQLKEQKEYVYTLLINDDWSDSVAIDWSLNAQKIIDRGHEYQLAELVNYYLSYGATTEALAQLDSISEKRGTYSLERTDNDMEEFILYNSYIFDMLNTQGKIDSLSPQNITELNYMADEFKGRAARQARNVLCFFLGECEAVSVMYEGKKNSIDKPSHQHQEPQKLERKLELGIYPNPNEGTFALVVPEGCVIAAIEVVDVNGRSVPFEEYAVRENTKDVKLVNPTNGILLVNVTCKDGSRYVNRLLISK